ncbi:hypothetical protein TNCV_4110471 [Trichonephila clavipes]|nr:hypothetical protein TNCV_4110471 [Trichonephila clavipes]
MVPMRKCRPELEPRIISPPPPNEQSCTTETAFNDVLLVVTGTWTSPYESPERIRLQAKSRLIGKHPTCPLLRRHNAFSILQANHSRQCITVSAIHLTDLRAYRPIYSKRLYTVML